MNCKACKDTGEILLLTKTVACTDCPTLDDGPTEFDDMSGFATLTGGGVWILPSKFTYTGVGAWMEDGDDD